MVLLSIPWEEASNLILFSFSMVFTLLLVIVVVLNIFGKIVVAMNNPARRPPTRKAGPTPEVSESHLETGESLSEVHVAIAMALHTLGKIVHDEESNIITINSHSKFYSPWSSKIYGLNLWSRFKQGRMS